RERHASNSSSTASSTESRSGTRPVSIATEVARSASSAGKARCARFTPTPMTIVTGAARSVPSVGGVPWARRGSVPPTPVAPVGAGAARPASTVDGLPKVRGGSDTLVPVVVRIRDSTRIPASLRPRASTSFGHLSRASMPVVRRSASATATAVAIENVARSAGAIRGRTRIEASRLVPGASFHDRPRRPRPADWWSATTTVRSGAPWAASPNATVCVDSTTERRTTGIGLAVIEPPEARRELFEERLVGGELLALARDDLGRGALDELRARELPLAELAPLGDHPDLLLEPRPLRSGVDDPGELDVDLRARHDGEGRVPRSARARVDPEARARQGLDQRAGGGEERLGAARRTQRGGEGHAVGDPHRPADVADRGHDVHDDPHLALRGRVVLLPRGLRVGRDHDRLALVRQPLPDLLRDERHERVQEAQR